MSWLKITRLKINTCCLHSLKIWKIQSFDKLRQSFFYNIPFHFYFFKLTSLIKTKNIKYYSSMFSKTKLLKLFAYSSIQIIN